MFHVAIRMTLPCHAAAPTRNSGSAIDRVANVLAERPVAAFRCNIGADQDGPPVGGIDDPVVAPGTAPVESAGGAGAPDRLGVLDDGAEQGEALAGVIGTPRQAADLVPE